MEKARRLLDEGGLWNMNNLQIYLCNLPLETVWMHFFANGCDLCPAKEFCDTQPDGTCCRGNFLKWAEGSNKHGSV